MVVTQWTADAAKKLAARWKTPPSVVPPAPAVTPSVDTTVKGTVPWTLDPNSSAYKKLAGMGLDDTKIQSMYGNIMKKWEITDTSKFNSAVAPQKVESLASVDTKINQPASQKTEVAVQPTNDKKTTTSTIIDPNKDDSEQRQAQILANLKNFEATTPEIFNDKAKYDQVVGRANKSPLQQQIVDNYFNSVKATKEKVAAVDKAKVELASMSDTVLGYLKPTAEQLSVINNDPALLARYTAATQQRSILDEIQKGFQPAEVPAIDGYDGIGWNISQEIVQMQATLAQQAEEYNAIQRKIDTVDEDTRAEYEGTGASDAYIQAKINKKKAELTKEAANKKWIFDITSSKIAALGTQAETIKAEQTAKQQEFINKINAFNTIMWIRNTQQETSIKQQLANQKEVWANEDPNVWKTAPVYNSKWKVIWQVMWNTKTQSYDIPVWWTMAWAVSIWSWSYGGWSGWWIKAEQATQRSQVLSSISNIVDWIRNDPLWRVKLASWYGDLSSDLAYLKNNLTLDKFIETKKQWATYGALSDSEWQIISTSASRLWNAPTLSEQKLINELNVISSRFWGWSFSLSWEKKENTNTKWWTQTQTTSPTSTYKYTVWDASKSRLK